MMSEEAPVLRRDHRLDITLRQRFICCIMCLLLDLCDLFADRDGFGHFLVEAVSVIGHDAANRQCCDQNDGKQPAYQFFHLNNLFPLYTLFASRPLPLRTFFLYDYVTTKPPRVKPSKTYKKDPARTFS